MSRPPQAALLVSLDPPDPGGTLLVGVTDEQPDLATVVRLLPEATAGELDEAVTVVARDGAQQVVAVLDCLAHPVEGAPWPRAAAARLLASLATGHGLIVLDVLLVHGGRWWSYECLTCLRSGGQPIPTRKDTTS